MPSTTLLYTTGIHQEHYSFVDVAKKNRWESEVMTIKAESSAAFNKKEAEGVTNEEVRS